MEKGSGDFGDSTWMAFREESFILNAEWEEEVVIGSVVLSSMVNTDPYLFPPESIVIRGGMEKSDMNVLARLIPEKLEERTDRYFEFYDCKIDPIQPIRYIEIVVQPYKEFLCGIREKARKVGSLLTKLCWVLVDYFFLPGE